MKSKVSILLPLAFSLFTFALPGRASLLGTSVTGSLVFAGDPSNYFDPGYGLVPATGYLNVSNTTVMVSDSAAEFGYDDGASLIAANFTDHQLVISDLIELSGPTNSFQIMFTDTAFAGQYMMGNSDDFPLNGSRLVGDVITLDYPGGNPTVGQTFTATFTFAPVPEPSTLDAVAIAALGVLAAFRMRSFRSKFVDR